MLVGIVGFIGSGKGTVGGILQSELGFEPHSFASSVKDVTAIMFDWPRTMLEGDTIESRSFREKNDEFWSIKFGRNFTPREAMQKIGTEVARKIFHENFWIDSLGKKLKNGTNYTITDVRFQNEMAFIKKEGGVIIEISRGKNPSWYEIAFNANEGSKKAEIYMMRESGIHESEWRWISSGIDATIQNDGSLDDLKKNLLGTLTDLLGSSTMQGLIDGVKNNATIK